MASLGLRRKILLFEGVVETKRFLLSFLIEAKRNRKSVVAYSGCEGQHLVKYCGVRTDFVDYIVDRSPHKQGHFLPGVHIPIYNPEHIRLTRPDYVLIMLWNLRDEIMSQMSFIVVGGQSGAHTQGASLCLSRFVMELSDTSTPNSVVGKLLEPRERLCSIHLHLTWSIFRDRT
jgi:hypothetical protein